VLSRIRIHNYKSIRNVTLSNLPNICIFVGANASGKSNFADSIDFLSMVFREGLAGAVRAKGGYANICFRRAKRSQAGLTFGVKATISPETPKEGSKTKKKESKWTFNYEFRFSTTGEAITAEYQVEFEKLALDYQQAHNQYRSLIVFERRKDKVVFLKFPSQSMRKELEDTTWIMPKNFFESYIEKPVLSGDELLMTGRLSAFPPFHYLTNMLRNCGVYQISPFVARETGIPERSPELGRHGENLPAAVNYIRRSHPDAYEELLEHVKHTVPTIDDLSTRYVETKQLGLFFTEQGVGRSWFSQDVSDGTIQTLSIFLPLVDPRKNILFIDEPENSLHPWILRHFIDTCKQHSKEKQIFITTQSPIAVNATPVDSLYIVTRRKGETQIDRCIDTNPELRSVVLEQLMGLGDYWDSGAVAGVPNYDEQLSFFEE
jgi:predicted ATPase